MNVIYCDVLSTEETINLIRKNLQNPEFEKNLRMKDDAYLKHQNLTGRANIWKKKWRVCHFFSFSFYYLIPDGS